MLDTIEIEQIVYFLPQQKVANYSLFSSERNHQVADKFRKVSCLNVYGRKRERVGVKQCMHSFHSLDGLLSVFFDDYMSKLFPIFYLANFVYFYPSKYRADLTVFLLKILCSLWLGGKCLSIRHRKLRAMFVLTFLLNGGLNQMILRCLFLRVFCDACFT